MNKQQIYNYLRQENIWHEITEHEAVYKMAELSNIEIPYPEYNAKNLFVRDDKKRNSETRKYGKYCLDLNKKIPGKPINGSSRYFLCFKISLMYMASVQRDGHV